MWGKFKKLNRGDGRSIAFLSNVLFEAGLRDVAMSAEKTLLVLAVMRFRYGRAKP